MRRLLTPILPPSLAAAALLVAPAFAAADDPVPAAKRLPPVTYGFVSVPDVTEAKARFDGTVAAGVFTDPALAEVRDMIAEKVGEAGEELRNRLGVTLEELAAVPTGEVTFAVVQTAPRKVAVVGLLDYGKSRDTVDALLEKAEDALDENGLTRSEEPFEGTEIVVWTAPAPEVDEFDEDFDPNATRPEPQRFGYFLKDSYLVVASDPTALEAVLVRWDGTHSSTFADSETFSYIADRTRSDDRRPVLVWYADVIGSVRSAVLGSGQGGMPVQLALSYLPVLGIDEFKAVGGSMDWATEDYASVGKVVLYADRTDRALGLFTFPPAPTAPPAWVPADAASYAAFNWDLAGAYDAVRATYDSMIGPGEFDRYVAEFSADRDVPVDVKADLIDAFSGKIELVSYPIAPEVLAESVESGEQPPQPVVIALGLKDPRKLSELLEKSVAGSGGRADQPRLPRHPSLRGREPVRRPAVRLRRVRRHAAAQPGRDAVGKCPPRPGRRPPGAVRDVQRGRRHDAGGGLDPDLLGPDRAGRDFLQHVPRRRAHGTGPGRPGRGPQGGRRLPAAVRRGAKVPRPVRRLPRPGRARGAVGQLRA